MRNGNDVPLIGNPVASVRYSADELQGNLSNYLRSSSYRCFLFRQKLFLREIMSNTEKKDSVVDWMSKFSKKTDSYAQGIREHVSLGPKITETVRGKLSLGARILKAGGIEKVFKRYFSAGKSEKLLKASQCYLSTTSGPIAGLLFISTEKIAFRSDRSLTFTSPNGDLVRIPYKVQIPTEKDTESKLKREREYASQKYIQIATVDEFEFWFMGFVSYQRSFKYLQQLVSESGMRP